MSRLPNRKHNDNELAKIKAQSAMISSGSSVLENYAKQLAPKAIVILGYALPLIAPLWVLVKKMMKASEYTIGDFSIMAIPVIMALGIAMWIALKREFSRHNAAFILMASILCSFTIFSVVSSSQYLKNQLLSLVGSEKLVQDSMLDFENESKPEEETESIQEALKKAQEKQYKERIKWEQEQAERNSAKPSEIKN